MILQIYPCIFGVFLVSSLVLALWGEQTPVFAVVLIMLVAAMIWLFWKGVRVQRVDKRVRQRINLPTKRTALDWVQYAILVAVVVCVWQIPRRSNPQTNPFFWAALLLFAALVVLAVIKRHRRPDVRKLTGLEWALYGLLLADLFGLVLLLLLPGWRRLFSWLVAAVSTVGLVAGILYCRRHPVPAQSAFCMEFRPKHPVAQRLTWYGSFCLVWFVELLSLVLCSVSAVLLPALRYPLSIVMALLWVTFLALLFPALLQWLWRRLCWRWCTRQWRMPKRTGLEWAGFWLSLSGAAAAGLGLVCVPFAFTVPAAVFLAVALFSLAAAAALAGWIVSLVGLARFKYTRDLPTPPQPPSMGNNQPG